MALIKKTIVLSDKKTNGYASVIRVGSETGVKVVGEPFQKGMYAALRIGKNKFYFPLDGERTEVFLSADVKTDDEIGCLVASGETVVAKGGAAPTMSDLSAHLRSLATEKTDPVENTPKEDPETIATDSSTEDSELLERLKKEKENYYYSIKDKVDELFVVHPEEPLLNALIPDSNWVKVRYDGEDYYVVGKLFDDEGKIKYLGYGVPGVESVRPPKVADGIASFLPLKDNPKKGYWLFFQNAENGKIE